MKNLQIDESTGLVLEGGGMRGVFTCGVLDYLMDNDIRFPYVIGVSAGACNGLSYASRQRGRAKYSNIDLLEQYNYIGMIIRKLTAFCPKCENLFLQEERLTRKSYGKNMLLPNRMGCLIKLSVV